MDEQWIRSEMLYGVDSFKRLETYSVAVFGVGGVGSFAAEALARSGIGTIHLIDHDLIDPTNLNRQIQSEYIHIGKPKAAILAKRIKTYNDQITVVVHDCFFNEAHENLIFSSKIDFVFDAIDTISSKMDLYRICEKKNIPCISCMGMGNRIDPQKVSIQKLKNTNYDPLARKIRELVKKDHIKKEIMVIFSSEIPIKQAKCINKQAHINKDRIPPASSIFVPSCAGIIGASYIVNQLIALNKKKDEE